MVLNLIGLSASSSDSEALGIRSRGWTRSLVDLGNQPFIPSPPTLRQVSFFPEADGGESTNNPFHEAYLFLIIIAFYQNSTYSDFPIECNRI